MAEVLLISPPPWGTSMPPLGVAYLAAHLRAKGLAVDVCDLNQEFFQAALPQQRQLWDFSTINQCAPQDVAAELWRNFAAQIQAKILQWRPYRIVGFSAGNVISAAFVSLVARQLKQSAAAVTTVAGGAGCHYGWDRNRFLSRAAIDFVVIGEGEQSLLFLINALRHGGARGAAAAGIPGVLPYGLDHAYRFVPPEPPADLDALAYPSFEEFSLDWYRDAAARSTAGGGLRLPILISRGCVNRCSYCIDCTMCRPFRTRSPELIVRELGDHVRKYGVRQFELNDLLCNGNLDHLEKFCDAVIGADLKISWHSYAIIRRDMSAGLFRKMRQSGCASICYGLESAADEILARMRKSYTAADARDILRRTCAAGIKTQLNVIVGFPGERDHEFEKTRAFLAENKEWINQVNNVSAFVLMPDADVGIYPHRYGITFACPDNPEQWADEYGLTAAGRNRRVRAVCETLRCLGIVNLIVNTATAAATGDEPVMPVPRRSKQQNTLLPVAAPSRCGTGSFRRARLLRKWFVLVFLFGIALVLDMYLWLLKKIRRSIIFPGT
ncbi:MAG: B12-binding domain-containing radical SAM protein [Candidatus Omnitrophica bacterium]|nr:B12-binding domain-containing radical SAM protein [Candidatus Omnitrophota bacterium]